MYGCKGRWEMGQGDTKHGLWDRKHRIWRKLIKIDVMTLLMRVMPVPVRNS